MFLDASAIVAILLREPGFESLVSRIETSATPLYCSPIARFEASVAFARQRSGGQRPTPDFLKESAALVSEFLNELMAKDIHVSTSIGSAAIDAAATYGKAVGHVADLNFGDCFAYACAKAYRLPLLYKGADFAQTDLA